MAYRSHTASPAGSQSPASSSSSPYIYPNQLDPTMPTDDPDSSYSTHGTPNHSTTGLPRVNTAGKGGCWTCRVRRKKCDEQREGDSCKTCKRLTINCLGWGPRRPDWMRDKKKVDAYKASIKAQLSRAGLIRGQPRHNPLAAPASRANAHVRQTHNAPSTNPFEFPPQSDPSFSQNINSNNHLLMLPGMPNSANSSYDDLARFEPFDPSTTFYPQYNAALVQDPLDTFLLHPSSNDAIFPDSMLMPPAQPMEEVATQEQLVMYYFDNVRKMQSNFGSEALINDITYQAIVAEPRGAVTLAISALADLHSKQTRISQGLEAFQNPERSVTNYWRNEALLQLENNKNTHGRFTDNDAIAAYHLVNFSQMSGGACDWEAPFQILVHWLMEINLHHAENPWHAFTNLTKTRQFFVKATLWLDVFASISTLRPPKFMALIQSLYSDQSSFWGSGIEIDQRLKMENMTGCPDDVMCALAEVSQLSHWKASQIRNGCLSYPELIRRGNGILQQLRRSQNELPTSPDSDQSGSADAAHPSREERVLISTIFRESAHLFLHTVLSNATPGVPEIMTSVQSLVRLFSQLFPSELDRNLVFPICIAGCMTNDSSIRDFFKNRLRTLNESFGNLMQTRRLMEAVWQKRDVNGKAVEIYETIREQGLRLLLI